MMHYIILTWVLFWIALFTAVVYWPRKPLLPVAQSWHPTEYDLRRLREAADKAYDETKNEPINDDWFKSEQQWHPTNEDLDKAAQSCARSLIEAEICGHKVTFSRIL